MSSKTASKSDLETPLCVDLDGTLINTDMLWESLVRLVKKNPLHLVSVLVWWCRGRAWLKAQIARRVTVDASTLPYNASLVSFIRTEKERGRKVLLVTASDAEMARGISDHLPVFDEVLASDGTRNLRGRNKGATLARLFGERGFDYAGNSSVDLPVWERARQAIVVNGSPTLQKRASTRAELGPVFPPATKFFPELLKVMGLLGDRRKGGTPGVCCRWSTAANLLTFLPLAFVPLGPRAFEHTLLGFVAFLLATWGTCVLREWFNIDIDRKDPSRRSRPFAAGTLKIQAGPIMGPLLLAGGFAAGLCPGIWFESVLAVFVLLALPGSGARRGFVKHLALNALRLLGGYLAAI